MKRFPLFLLTAALLAGPPLLAGCGEGQAAGNGADGEAPERRYTRVETLVLRGQTFEDRIEITGAVEALDDATLSAQASGTVTTLADLGAYVREGETVAQIDPEEAKMAVTQAAAAVQSAEAQRALAQDRYDRQEPLYRDSIISAAEFEAVRSQLTQAEAALAQAEAQRDQAKDREAKTRVAALFAGTVEEHFVERGEQVRPGDEVARVVNTRRVKVTAGAPERYAGDIERGTPVVLNVRGARGLSDRQARVTFVGSAINPQSRTFPIEVTVDNPDGRLKPEMVVDLEVPREEITGALVIPRTAVVRDEDGTKVFVAESVRGDTVAVTRERAVTLGSAYNERVVVQEGLEAGASVIVLGQTTVAPGDTVAIAERYTRIPEAGTPFSEETTNQ